LDEICECLKIDSQEGEEEFINLKKLHLLTELYQMLPLKAEDHKNQSKQMGSIFTDHGRASPPRRAVSTLD
jgi:hypothetical protein